jgi:hypothetical protein
MSSLLERFSARFGVLMPIIWAYVGEDLTVFLICYLDFVDKPAKFAIKRKKYDWQDMADKCAAAYEPGFLWIRHQPVHVSYLQALRHAIECGSTAMAIYYERLAAGETYPMDKLRDATATGYLREYWPKGLSPACMFEVSAARSGYYEEFVAAGGIRSTDSVERAIVSLELASKGLSVAVSDGLKDAMGLAIYYGDTVAMKNLFRDAHDTVWGEHIYMFWEAFEENGCLDAECRIDMLEIMIDNNIIPPSSDFICFSRSSGFDETIARCLMLLVRKHVLRPAAIAESVGTVRAEIVHNVLQWCASVIQNDDNFWHEIGLA